MTKGREELKVGVSLPTVIAIRRLPSKQMKCCV